MVALALHDDGNGADAGPRAQPDLEGGEGWCRWGEARKTQRGEQQATVVGGHRWESALDVAR